MYKYKSLFIKIQLKIKHIIKSKYHEYFLYKAKTSSEKYLLGGTYMIQELDSELREKAKDMIMNGDSFDEIMEKTHLRLKDLKRIQREEITPKF